MRGKEDEHRYNYTLMELIRFPALEATLTTIQEQMLENSTLFALKRSLQRSLRPLLSTFLR